MRAVDPAAPGVDVATDIYRATALQTPVVVTWSVDIKVGDGKYRVPEDAIVCSFKWLGRLAKGKFMAWR